MEVFKSYRTVNNEKRRKKKTKVVTSVGLERMCVQNMVGRTIG